MKTGNYKRAISAAILCLVTSTAIYAGGRMHHRDGGTPVEVTISPVTGGATGEVLVTVEMSGPSSSDQTVAIGAIDPDAFSYIPTAVVVPAGYSGVSFTAYETGAAFVHYVVAATCNGITVLNELPAARR